MASRIMDFADGNQILVSQTVFERLTHREKYMKLFRPYRAVTKHAVELSLYQYIGEHLGVSTQEPAAFRPRSSAHGRLPLRIAYYFAHALQNRSTLLKHKEIGDEPAATVLLWFLSKDSVAIRQARETDRIIYDTEGEHDESFETRLQHYRAIPFSVLTDLTDFIVVNHLAAFTECFVERIPDLGARFVNRKGATRLINEWPEIAAEFGIVAPSSAA